MISRVSRGLVEVSAHVDTTAHDTDSIPAGPGSMLSDTGETRLVRPIHSSVGDFMLRHGFNLLARNSLPIDPIVANGHLFLAMDCLQYMKMHELDSWIESRRVLDRRLVDQSQTSSPSGSGDTRFSGSASFHSAVSSRGSALSMQLPLRLAGNELFGSEEASRP